MKPAAMLVCTHIATVMAGPVPAIHVFLGPGKQDVDARDERGHDALESVAP